MLQLIEYKNRFWLFLLVIPLVFFLFISNFLICFYLRPSDHSIWFYLAFAFFLLEMHLLTIFISRFRFIPNGQIKIDQRGVISENSSVHLNLNWSKISDMTFYYRGDRFWKSNILGFPINHGKGRYQNLRWELVKEMNQKLIDRIDINGKAYYVKIRNENEKLIFHEFIDVAKSRIDNVQTMKTNFSFKLFGRVYDENVFKSKKY